MLVFHKSVIVILTLVLTAACSAPDVPNALVDTAPSTTPSDSAPPGAEASPEPSETRAPIATRAPKLTVRITKAADVSRGSNMTIEAKTKARAVCSILVWLPTGSLSGAQGLNPNKKAGPSGLVSWTWKTGPTTKRGKARAVVACDLGSASGSGSKTFSFK